MAGHGPAKRWISVFHEIYRPRYRDMISTNSPCKENEQGIPKTQELMCHVASVKPSRVLISPFGVNTHCLLVNDKVNNMGPTMVNSLS
mmetsp:Transcript_11940/g.19463  ORF Transcript_11940/g.19463 Transcript_11940/m.19463 type:complete len:88 (-) Transcript_11940:778-1041(-)